MDQDNLYTLKVDYDEYWTINTAIEFTATHIQEMGLDSPFSYVSALVKIQQNLLSQYHKEIQDND